VKIPEILSAMDEAIQETPAQERPALVVQILALAGQAAARMTNASAPATVQEMDRLLTLPDVAKVLGVPEDRAYDLARRAQLPVVTVGKYKRVRLTALWVFIHANEKRQLDADISLRLASQGDGRRRSKAEKAARSDAGRIREARRRPQDHGGKVGRRDPGPADHDGQVARVTGGPEAGKAE
jgi:hypothetical protein